DRQVLAGACELLLRVGMWNSKAADVIGISLLLFLFLYLRAIGAESATLVVKIEGEVHAVIEQILDNVGGGFHFLVVCGFFDVERRKVERSLIFGALVETELLEFREILPCGIDVAHGFVEKSKFPVGEGKIGRNFLGASERGERTIVLT